MNTFTNTNIGVPNNAVSLALPYPVRVAPLELTMSPSNPDRMSIPRRTFGVDESALDDSESMPQEPGAVRRVLGHVSFGTSQHRPSFLARWRKSTGGESDTGASTSNSERPPIPTMMHSSGEAYTTPLPVLSMIVLSIVRRINFHL